MTQKMDVRSRLLDLAEKSSFSERRLSMRATRTPDALRNIRRGSAPRIDTVEALCEVLGVKLQIGPGLLPPNEEGVLPARPPTEFTGSLQLPVYEWAVPSEKGYVRRPDDAKQAPAPVDMLDEQAFYWRMPDASMAPAWIAKNDYCLVSPCAPLEVDARLWIRGPTGLETTGWVMRRTAAGFDLGAWDLDENIHSKLTAVHWKREDIVDRGVVVDVYHEKPTAAKMLQPVADWHPDPQAELSRSALSNGALKKLADDLDKAVSVVEEVEREIRLLAGTGKISDSDAEQLRRVVEHRLQNSLSAMRSSVSGKLPDESEGTPAVSAMLRTPDGFDCEGGCT